MQSQPSAGSSTGRISNVARKIGQPGQDVPQQFAVHKTSAPSQRELITASQPIRAMKAPQATPYQRKSPPPPPANRGATAQKRTFVQQRTPAASQKSTFSYIAPLLSRERSRINKTSPSPPWWMHDASELPARKATRGGSSMGKRTSARMTATVSTLATGEAASVSAKNLLVKVPGHDVLMPKDAWFPTDSWSFSDGQGSDTGGRSTGSSSGPSGRRSRVSKAVSSKTVAWQSPPIRPSGPSDGSESDSSGDDTFWSARPTRTFANKSPRKSTGGKAPRLQLATKAARKRKPSDMGLWLEDHDDSGSSDTEPNSAHDKRTATAISISASSSASESESDSGGKSLADLKAALDALTLPTVRLLEYRRIPFLLRNMRRGFVERCRSAGVSIVPQAPPRDYIHVRFQLLETDKDPGLSSQEDVNAEREWQRTGRMSHWKCPLCRLHGPLANRAMLNFHLTHDHDEVKWSWQETVHEGNIHKLLCLDIPEFEESGDELEDESEESEESEEEEIASARLSPPLEGRRFSRERTPFKPFAGEIGVRMASEVIDLTSPPASPQLIPKKFRADSPARPSHTPVPRRSTTDQPRQSYRGSLPARYPSPSPPSNSLGPSAQYPYLPEPTEGQKLMYSCRPGGPRIFDLLNELSLKPFGVLAWSIVEREEELFEMDDIRDEDKVLLALWNRWIMLNRFKFIFEGYAKGVIAFVDDNWQMIHKGAGWAALRAFLLMLVANKFLNVSEVVRILKHYELHTGMDHWYAEEEAGRE